MADRHTSHAQGLSGDDPDFPPPGPEEPLAADIEGRVRALQVRSVVRLTPLTAAVNALNAGIVLVVFSDSPLFATLCAWAFLVLLANGSALRNWRRTRGDAAPRSVSARGIQRATRRASLLAVLWAMPAALLFPDAAPDRQLLLTALTTGMMCAGGFALSTMRGAGSAYALIVGAGAAVALLRSELSIAMPLTGLLVLYAVTVVVSVIFTSTTFRARVVAELRAERQSQVIGLLLRDFEQHAADVLWETDEALRLRRVSPRLAAFFGEPVAALEGQALPALVERLQAALPAELLDEAGTAAGRLRAALAGDRPFRDLELPAHARDRLAWWSFTAKPLPQSGWRGVISDVTAAQDARRHVWHLAHHDAVTGLANRRRFREVLTEAVAQARDGGWQCALLCVDLDGFKAVNDGFGHTLGDRLLGVIGQRLQGQARQGDLAARLGGDEFGVVLRRVASPEDALQAARRMLAALQRPVEVDGVTIPIGACLGAAFCPDDGDEPETLLRNADLALYAAKAEGRGRMRCFSTDMGARLSERLRIEHELGGALAAGQLWLEYQPKVSLASGRITGFEALVRWRHPQLGLVRPEVFIPVAEESGLIQELGEWVLGEACREARRWPRAASVAVNISGLQLMGSDIVSVVSSVLADTGLEAPRLELEITESVLMGDSETTLRALHGLRRLGVRIALDDFGTGYSAMAYLRRFPFDTLKIDRSFVSEFSAEEDSRAIVGAIVELAHALNMVTVAEGVEDEASLSLLAAQRCDLAQGNAIARPLPAADVAGFLESAGYRALPGTVPLFPDDA